MMKALPLRGTPLPLHASASPALRGTAVARPGLSGRVARLAAPVVARHGGASDRSNGVLRRKLRGGAGRAASSAQDGSAAVLASAPQAALAEHTQVDTDARRTLGAFVHTLLLRRLRKAVKLRKRALRQVETGDLAEDAVREVRVALRRLRNTLQGVDKALVLPAAAQPKQLTPALRALGASRDAEAVAACVRSAAGAASAADGLLPPAEERALAAALAAVAERHATGTRAAARALSSRRVQRALAALDAAAAAPDTRKLAARPAADGAARLLLHAVVNLFAHDAWELDDLCPSADSLSRAGGLGAAAARRAVARRAPWEHALNVTAKRCETLHALRKSVREVRYMMEAYAPLYDSVPAFTTQLAALTSLQAHVGTMRDVEVALAMLPELVACPAICGALQAAHSAAWAAFRTGREPLLSPKGRAAVYNAILCVAGGSGGGGAAAAVVASR